MKNIVMHLVLALTLLLTLGAVFGSVASGTAHAATATKNINPAVCNNSTTFEIVSSTSTSNIGTCFANSGSTPVTIPGVWLIYTGAYSGYIIMTNGSEYTFNPKQYLNIDHQTSEFLYLS